MKTFILLFLFTITLYSQNNKLYEEAKEAIEKGNAQWVKGTNEKNPKMIAELFAEDGVMLVDENKIVKGRSAIQKMQQDDINEVKGDLKATVETKELWLDGNTAYETGRYTYSYEKDGKPVERKGRYFTIWEKQKDNSWRIKSDVGFPDEKE